MSETNGNSETYTVIYAPRPRTWVLRKVPKHVFMMFGQLPSMLTEKAVAALQAEDETAFGEELQKNLSAEELTETIVFMREVVKFACVKPQISFTRGKDNVSPFDISNDEFQFLMKCVRSGGGEADRLNSFREQPGQAAGNIPARKNRAKKRK